MYRCLVAGEQGRDVTITYSADKARDVTQTIPLLEQVIEREE